MPIFRTNKAHSIIYVLGSLASTGGKPGTITQAVVDGDTLRVLLPGGQGLRFLGCDTPEKRIALPLTAAEIAAGKKQGPFVKLDDPRWTEFLNSVFDDSKWGPFKPRLSDPLIAYLKSRIKRDAAANQWQHAEAATNALRALIKEDATARGLDDKDLKFFIVLAHEVLDRYGRPLVFVNIDEPAATKRPPVYNERMIANGRAAPLFIWPNIDPFREMKVTDAAMRPRDLRRSVARSRSLQAARQAAAAARAAGLGIYEPSDPLQLEAFELRFLAGRRGPSRWVIDLAADEDDARLLRPDRYFRIPNVEDRLYIPNEYVPLFREKEWR